MGASEGLQILFSYSSNPIFSLFFLVFSCECLEIRASLSISWATISCMILVFSCRSLNLTYFLPRALDSFLFLIWRILLVCCHLLLDVLGYAHWSCSLFYILHLSWARYFIFLVDLPNFIFNSIFLLQEGERRVFTFAPFWDIRLDHLIILSLMELELKVESRIFWYRLSIDLVLVLSFTPHLFSSHLDHFLDHL